MRVPCKRETITPIFDPRTIDGFSYNPDSITEEEETALITAIDALEWNEDLERRTQQYGWQFAYAKGYGRGGTIDKYLGDLPEWAIQLAKDLLRKEILTCLPDCLIVNEYTPGQGISGHRDKPCYMDEIATVSLGSQAMMRFWDENPQKRGVKHKGDFLLEQRSTAVFRGDARFKWRHGIPARQSDVINGKRVQRGRRISITFRTVKEEVKRKVMEAMK